MITTTTCPPRTRPEVGRHVRGDEVSATELLPVGIVPLRAVPPDPRPRETNRMPETAKRVTVVVVDDHPVFREGVVRALTSSGRVEVLAEAGDGRDALAQIEEHRPDVVLLDYKLPELSGLAVAHAIVRDGLPTKILFLSAHTESSVVTRRWRPGPLATCPKKRVGSRSWTRSWRVPPEGTSCRRMWLPAWFRRSASGRRGTRRC